MVTSIKDTENSNSLSPPPPVQLVQSARDLIVGQRVLLELINDQFQTCSPEEVIIMGSLTGAVLDDFKWC